MTTDTAARALPDQPDGIDEYSSDLPDSHRAAERVGEWIAAWGDGLIDTADGHPLYARDLEALRRAVPAADAYATARRVAAWLATTNGSGRDQQTLQILKVTEEAGEVASAWIGTVGQNPRKGITHTTDDVADELADVVLTALVAIAGLGLDPQRVVGNCVAKVAARLNAAAPSRPHRDEAPLDRPVVDVHLPAADIPA
ncbi:MazG-like family protein [Micromonospora sp. NBC_01655]|uniref:MazG-like family protein n=1 Tax=Micromonospora sp. NBC_01655 TaxID=2975983 RepID=UPI00225096A5|nr:MazG-like family protein [Micromonospora sp. NBC_01655]MCX4470481.1 MazG-like family protein [Micromonospora sp. NBC_01655]